ncbi:MAG: hypothetical protein ACLQU2_24195 [Candidatus Binataceae bacterium]
MNRRLRRSMTFPLIARTLIVAILVGGLPMLAGVVATAQDSRPAFTLDICHPIGGAAHTLTPGEAPLVPVQGAVQTLYESGVVDEFVIDLSSRLSEAPIPPPPKIGA